MKKKEIKRRVRRFLFDLFGGRCVYCARITNLTLPESPGYCSIEHAIPVSLGGQKAISSTNKNLVLACQKCNNARRSQSFVVFCRLRQRHFDGNRAEKARLDSGK